MDSSNGSTLGLQTSSRSAKGGSKLSDAHAQGKNGGARLSINRLFSEEGSIYPYLYLVPHGIFFLGFVVYPIFKGLYVSLTDWDMFTNSGTFAGLENYKLLFNPETVQYVYYWQALGNTFTFVLLSVPLLIGVALGLAVLLSGKLPGKGIFRTIFFLPTALTVSVVAVIWRWLLNANHGYANYLLSKVGIKEIAWLTSQPWAWISITMATVWWTVGWNMVLLLNGINGIPEELYEASRIDGATSWQIFRYITVPCLRPVMLYVGITTVIASFNLFGQPQLMTGGGPTRSTLPVMLHIYGEAWGNYRMGTATAMAYVTGLFMLVVTLVQARFLSGRIEY